MDISKHPLLDFPEDEKVDYLSIVASIAAADGRVSDDEITQMRQYCETIEIGGIGIGMILNAVEDPSVIDVPVVLERLSHTELKFTLLSDMLFMAYADGVVSPGEREEIEKIAVALGISRDQIAAIDRYIKNVLSAQQSESSSSEWKCIGRDIAAALAGTGVPVGAVAISGCLCNPGAAMLSSGLEALGMGLGLTPGIGVAFSLGVCSYFGVRWLYDKL